MVLRLWLGGKAHTAIGDDTLEADEIKLNSKEIDRLIEFNKKTGVR